MKNRPRKFFAVAKGTAQVDINDMIGMGGFYAANLRDALAAHDNVKAINVSICSQGGNIVEGLAIYNILRAHKAPVTVEITGVAASMASVIAMAGDTIRMAKNSFMMIHNPVGGIDGESDDMRKQADVLDKMRDMLAGIYAERTGQDIADVVEAMAKETWMTADEALALGYCTEVTPEKTMAARLNVARWKNAPTALRRAQAKVRKMDEELIAQLGLEPNATKEEISAALTVLQKAAAAAVKAGVAEPEPDDDDEEMDPKKKKAKARAEAAAALQTNGMSAVLAELKAMRKDITAVAGRVDGSEREKLIAANIKKFTPTLEAKARKWPIDVLRDFCESASDVQDTDEEPVEAGAPRGPRAAATEIKLDAVALKVAKELGMTPEEFLAAKKADAARNGLKVVA
jgi:ATP-dependent Clp endopeptidase proteolytic subunit ClpP